MTPQDGTRKFFRKGNAMLRGTLNARMTQQYDHRGNPSASYLAEALSFEELSQTGVDESTDHDDRYDGLSNRPSEQRIKHSVE